MSKRITIAGLGWLGLPLAHHLKTLGYKVKGSVTSKDKAHTISKTGIMTCALLFGEQGITGAIKTLLDDTEVLLIMIPPGLRRNTGADYALKMSHFVKAIAQTDITKIVLVSSISVYDDSQGLVTEREVPKPQLRAGKQLFEVEQLFFNAPELETTIIRFGGLFGGNRNPVKFLVGRTNLHNGKAPVNLIHRDDCIGILTEVVKQEVYGHIFNGVMPQHPTKEEYYQRQAERLGLPLPEYENAAEGIFKQVDSINLEEVLGYTFKRKL